MANIRRRKMMAMKKSLKYMRNSGLAKGLNKWSNKAALGMKDLATMLMSPQQAYTEWWARWVKYAKKVRPQHRAMRKAVGYMLRQGKTRGWLAWYTATEAGRKAKDKKRKVMAKGAKHMLHRGLSLGWRGWVAMIVERVRLKRMLRVGAIAFKNHKMFKCWQRWSAVTDPRWHGRAVDNVEEESNDERVDAMALLRDGPAARRVHRVAAQRVPRHNSPSRLQQD